MLSGDNVFGIWLYASSPLGAPPVSATYTLRLPSPKYVFAQISIARDIEDGAVFDIRGGDVALEVLPPNKLSAFILRWSKFDEQGFGGAGFPSGQEPSIIQVEHCVDLTFQLDAVFRTGVATATVMAFE